VNTESGFSILLLGDFGVSDPRSIILGTVLSSIVTESDIVSVNFEGALHTGVLLSPTQKAIPQSELSVQWCVDNGINLISLANNHIMDFGAHGLLKTIKSIPEKCGYVGAGTWNEVYAPYIRYIHGLKIGFLAGTSADFSSLKSEWDDKEKLGCAWIRSPHFQVAVQRAVRECDYLYILPHAGVEHCDLPLPEWRDLYRSWIDMGAAGVIASHPHVPQGFEIYHKAPIFYSLGNFAFEGTKSGKPLPPYWCNSVAAWIKCKNGKMKVNALPVRFSDGVIEVDNDQQIQLHLQELNGLLRNDAEYMKRLNQMLPSFASKFEAWLLNSMNAVVADKSFASIRRFIYRMLKGEPNLKLQLHQLREESTITTITRDLKNKSNAYL
jgi:capA family protein